MERYKQKEKAFSLVELVIVIVILGIIAAIAIPRISSGSRNAGESALRANLASLRNAIDWYYGEHNNIFPGAKTDGMNGADTQDAFINQLTLYSNANGQVSQNLDAAYPYGPYLRTWPACPVSPNAGKVTVTVVNQPTVLAATPGNGNGWVYNTATGQIIVNSNDTGKDGEVYCTY